MTLRQLRDRLSIAQIAIACATVIAGGAMRWSSAIIAAGFVTWAFYRPLPALESHVAQRRWTWLVGAALVVSTSRAMFLGEVLDAGVDFLLLLVVQRFFQRQRSREHLQLLALGALLIIVGAVVNTGLNYPALFALYLLVACMALIVNHLLSEGERLGTRVHAEVTRAAVRSQRTLWRASLGTSGLALAGGVAVFLVFPRFGVGVFLRGPMAQEPRSGFSGDVELGGFGRIKTDTTVIARMRPAIPTDLPTRLTWYLRGSSLDRYEAGRWSQSREGETTPLRRVSHYLVPAPNGKPVGQLVLDEFRDVQVGPVPIPGFAASTETARAQIILEDQGVDALFAASHIVGVDLVGRGALEQRNKLRGGYNGELRLDKLPGPIQYTFVSRIGVPTREELRAVHKPPPLASLDPYLQGRGEFSDRFSSLAHDLTQGADSREEEVERVVAHLQTFRYSLDLREPEGDLRDLDPIETFLFETRAGHCEYFATALAVLLREVGIPTRIVNGYYGAHYNDLGAFYAIRQADAHSWVEVHFGDLGWVTIDPTPVAGRIAGDDAPTWPAWSQAIDAMRNAYLEYVIDYDLQKQMDMFKGLRGNASPRYRAASRSLRWALAVLGIVAIGLLLRRQLQRRRRSKGRWEQGLFTRVEARYRKLGHGRAASESAGAWATRLEEHDAPEVERLRIFLRRYEAIRFGPAIEGSSEARSRLAEAADDILAALRLAARDR